MSYLNKDWLTASVSIASLILGIATFVGTRYLPEAQGLPLFVILGFTTMTVAIVGFLLGVESYRKTRKAHALIGMLVGGGMLVVILLVLLSPRFTV